MSLSCTSWVVGTCDGSPSFTLKTVRSFLGDIVVKDNRLPWFSSEEWKSHTRHKKALNVLNQGNDKFHKQWLLAVKNVPMCHLQVPMLLDISFTCGFAFLPHMRSMASIYMHRQRWRVACWGDRVPRPPQSLNKLFELFWKKRSCLPSKWDESKKGPHIIAGKCVKKYHGAGSRFHPRHLEPEANLRWS